MFFRIIKDLFARLASADVASSQLEFDGIVFAR